MRRALSDYVTQGIHVVVLDNESTDQTVAICKEFLGRGVLRIDNLPWNGAFDLSRQLAAKRAVVENLWHDWVIHADADEWLQSPIPGESLIEAISRTDSAGFNAINFEEFVFVPEAERLYSCEDYWKTLLHYYYFKPAMKRLVRIWKRSAGLSNESSGGHTVAGGKLCLSPDTFILRHYIVLSFEHAVSKYVGRKFATVDVQKGWHTNRSHISAEQLKLPSVARLKHLHIWDSKELDRSAPENLHYWQW